MRADVARVSAALPRGAVTGTQSYLEIKLQESSGIAPIVPFVVAFGVIGLVLSVLIVVNVVSGAVVAGYRRIGILKSIGFTPGQVVAAYTGQVLAPAVAGSLGGVVLGNVLAVPLLAKTANVYGVGALIVPVCGRGRPRRDVRPGHHQLGAARAAGGAAEHGPGDRHRPRPAHRPGLRRAPAARHGA